MRPIPKLAVDFVSRFEGYRSKAYLCSAGVWTLGYGHTAGVKESDICTKAEALIWLAEDMQVAARKLYGVLKPEIIDALTEEQWSALLSFAFNLGAAPGWQIWKLLNARKFDQAADQFSRFINAGGKKIPGLAARRAAEFALWHEGEGQAPPSSVTRAVGMTPPTPEPSKSLFASKTAWLGGAVTGLGMLQGNAQTVQGIVAPQAYHNPLLGKLLGFTAVLIVGCGIAIVAFKAIENWIRTHR